MSYNESYLDHLNYYNTLLPHPREGGRTWVPNTKLNIEPGNYPNRTIPPQLCACAGAGCSRCMPNNDKTVNYIDEGMVHINRNPIGMMKFGKKNETYRSFNTPYNQPYGPDYLNTFNDGRMFFTQNRNQNSISGEQFVGVGPSYLSGRGPNFAEMQDAQQLNSIWGGGGTEGFFHTREGASLGRRSGPMVQRSGGRIISSSGRPGGRGSRGPGGRPGRGGRRPIVINTSSGTGSWGYGPYAGYVGPAMGYGYGYPIDTVYIEKDSTPQVLSPEQCDFKYEKCLEKQQKPKSDDAKTNCLNYVQNTGCAYYKK